jgi:hypothetical protein
MSAIQAFNPTPPATPGFVQRDVDQNTRSQVITGNAAVTFRVAVGQLHVIRWSGTFGGGNITVAAANRPGDTFTTLRDANGTDNLVVTAPGSREYRADGNLLRFTMAGSTSPNVRIDVATCF